MPISLIIPFIYSDVTSASIYLTGGVLQVWVVDPAAQSVTGFYPDLLKAALRYRAPKTYINSQVITDDLFPG